jgi:CubicO group peptidase (beta-lactamase class C family)
MKLGNTLLSSFILLAMAHTSAHSGLEGATESLKQPVAQDKPQSVSQSEDIPPIELSKINPDKLSTGPYSYFIPPYSFYYLHNMDKLGFKLDWIRRSGDVYPLIDDSNKKPLNVSYKFRNKKYDLDQFFKRNNVTGFLVLKDNNIISEQYFHEATKDSRFVSNSVGKSITSTLIGIALQEGKIKDLNDLVTKYAPSLTGTAFDRVTIKETLAMATAIDANENPADPTSIVHQMDRAIIRGVPSFSELLKSIKHDPKVKPGTSFNYVSMNTQVLGLVIEGATGKRLHAYLQDKIWTKIGAQSDAFLYRAEAQPDECAFGCLNATVRDYGRFGLMMMNGGTLGDTQVVNADWIKQATTPFHYTGTNESYGYQWWLPKDNKDVFEAIGVYGQMIYINPKEHVVIVTMSAWPKAEDPARWDELSTVMNAITTSLSKP